MIVSMGSLGVPARAVILFVAVEAASVFVLGLVGSADARTQRQTRDVNCLLVRELLLTDLALSSGTSYTRHPSQADVFAPHNEHPAAIEHFPAGSIVHPPVVPPNTSIFPGNGDEP